MERFVNIDWNPALEDMIDSCFVNDERLERESIMHRIMKGSLVDPFKNIDEDYQEVKLDLLENVQNELRKSNAEDSNKIVKGINNRSKKEPDKKIKQYVPGLVKRKIMFPKMSKLNKEQQAMCLRVLLRFSQSGKPKITQTEREELKKYMDLQPIISEEQNEFLELAKSNWGSRQLKITCEDYINLRWKSKLQYMFKLPRYYVEEKSIPLTGNTDIGVNFISTCFESDHLPRIILPTLNKPCRLYTSIGKLQNRFPPKNYTCGTTSASFKVPVSEDSNCQKFADDNNVDVVISSSGLNCLVNNVGSNYSSSWIIPVVLKAHNDRNIVYIDKPLPSVASTIPQKNNWVYKYILKIHFIPTEDSTAEWTEERADDNIFENTYSEELLKMEEEEENRLMNTSASKKKHLEGRASEKNVYTRATPNTSNCSKEFSTQTLLNSDDINDVTNVSGEATRIADNTNLNRQSDRKDKVNAVKSDSIPLNESIDVHDHKFETSAQEHVSYKIFTIGPQSSEQNELMKNNIVKHYKMLVRTKTDGSEVLKDGSHRMLMLSPKLEYQPDLGAEAVTLTESLRQWISLIFRPDTFLARVRISAETSEVIQIENRTAISINNEIQRIHKIKAEDSLTVLYNIIHTLSTLSPGRHIVRHTLRDGAFATVHKEVNSPGKNVFDLHTVHGKEFYTLPNPPWPQLDKIVPTPMLKLYERMPAMYYPVNKSLISHEKNFTQTGKFKAGTVRRSMRNRKAKVFHDAD